MLLFAPRFLFASHISQTTRRQLSNRSATLGRFWIDQSVRAKRAWLFLDSYPILQGTHRGGFAEGRRPILWRIQPRHQSKIEARTRDFGQCCVRSSLILFGKSKGRHTHTIVALIDWLLQKSKAICLLSTRRRRWGLYKERDGGLLPTLLPAPPNTRLILRPHLSLARLFACNLIMIHPVEQLLPPAASAFDCKLPKSRHALISSSHSNSRPFAPPPPPPPAAHALYIPHQSKPNPNPLL